MAPACVLPTVGAACSEQPLELPGPQRAAVAIERAAPKVTERLRALGASLGDPVFIRAYKQENDFIFMFSPVAQAGLSNLRVGRFALLQVCWVRRRLKGTSKFQRASMV
jgi:hypothetical protein